MCYLCGGFVDCLLVGSLGLMLFDTVFDMEFGLLGASVLVC